MEQKLVTKRLVIANVRRDLWEDIASYVRQEIKGNIVLVSHILVKLQVCVSIFLHDVEKLFHLHSCRKAKKV